MEVDIKILPIHPVLFFLNPCTWHSLIMHRLSRKHAEYRAFSHVIDEHFSHVQSSYDTLLEFPHTEILVTEDTCQKMSLFLSVLQTHCASSVPFSGKTSLYSLKDAEATLQRTAQGSFTAIFTQMA